LGMILAVYYFLSFRAWVLNIKAFLKRNKRKSTV
jgi:hypothetical protein